MAGHDDLDTGQHTMLARALCLAWAVLAAGQEDIEEVGFSFDGGQVLPPSPPAPGAINLESSSPASTWGAWRMVRLNDDLFVQSLDGNKRFHLCVCMGLSHSLCSVYYLRPS